MCDSSEAKTTLRSLPESEQQAIDAAERSLPDSARRRAIGRAIDDIAASLVGALTSIMEQGREPDEAAALARQAMATTLMPAYQLGREAAGMAEYPITREESAVFADLVEAEVEFFERFMRSMAEEAMSSNQRVGMYGESAHSAFWRGWLTMTPSNAAIEWRVTPAEHCTPRKGFRWTCLQLARNGPYSKPGSGLQKPLPTRPKDGRTPCISNCKCYLHMVRPFEAGLKNQIGVEVTAFGGIVVDSQSPAARRAAESYAPLARRYAHRQRLHAVDPGGGHSVVASRLRRDMDELAERLGHQFVMKTTMAEIRAPVTIARARGYRWVSPDTITDDLVTATAIIILLDSSDGGTITDVQSSPPSITLDGDQEYAVGDDSMNLLFVR